MDSALRMRLRPKSATCRCIQLSPLPWHKAHFLAASLDLAIYAASCCRAYLAGSIESEISQAGLRGTQSADEIPFLRVSYVAYMRWGLCDDTLLQSIMKGHVCVCEAPLQALSAGSAHERLKARHLCMLWRPANNCREVHEGARRGGVSSVSSRCASGWCQAYLASAWSQHIQQLRLQIFPTHSQTGARYD